MVECPRCKRNSINTFRVKRSEVYMEVCKCKTCGFLFIEDDNALEVAKADVRKLFIEDLRRLGR